MKKGSVAALPEKKQRPISECETCLDLADKGFEATNPAELNNIALRFLTHVIENHTQELMAVLAEKYVPIFMGKRALR